jgi:hypothetical protein
MLLAYELKSKDKMFSFVWWFFFFGQVLAFFSYHVFIYLYFFCSKLLQKGLVLVF